MTDRELLARLAGELAGLARFLSVHLGSDHGDRTQARLLEYFARDVDALRHARPTPEVEKWWYITSRKGFVSPPYSTHEDAAREARYYEDHDPSGWRAILATSPTDARARYAAMEAAPTPRDESWATLGEPHGATPPAEAVPLCGARHRTGETCGKERGHGGAHDSCPQEHDEGYLWSDDQSTLLADPGDVGLAGLLNQLAVAVMTAVGYEAVTAAIRAHVAPVLRKRDEARRDVESLKESLIRADRKLDAAEARVRALHDAIERAIAAVNGYSDNDHNIAENILRPALRAVTAAAAGEGVARG